MEKMLLRLRSPIFDHAILGIPVRKQPRRLHAKEDQEFAELREMGCALMEAKTLGKEEWRAAAKQVRLVI